MYDTNNTTTTNNNGYGEDNDNTKNILATMLRQNVISSNDNGENHNTGISHIRPDLSSIYPDTSECVL